MKYLLDNNANVNQPPAAHCGLTALQAAARGGHLAAIKLLLDNGGTTAEPAAWSGGLTAMQAAAKGGHLKALELLIDYNGDIDEQPGFDGGRTALQAAAEAGHLDILEFLLSLEANIDAEPAFRNGLTAFQAAVVSGKFHAMSMVLNEGVDDIDRKFESETNPEFHGRSPMEWAVRSGRRDVVRRLLRTAASVSDTAMNDAKRFPSILSDLRCASKEPSSS